MNFGDLKSISRGIVPGAKTSVISNTVRDLILNEGAKNVAALTQPLKTSTLFAATADIDEYDLTTIDSKFLSITEEGLWWDNGTNWIQLKPRTIKWLDDNYSTWRDADSSDPEYYYQYGDTIGVYPAPDTTLADGFKLYYSEQPPTMTSNAKFPFGGDTEISRLAILSESILTYWRVQALKIIGKASGDEITIAKKDYMEEVAEKAVLINNRFDISADMRL